MTLYRPQTTPLTTDTFTKQPLIASIEKIARLYVGGVEDFALSQEDLLQLTNLAIKDSEKELYFVSRVEHRHHHYCKQQPLQHFVN